MNNPKRITEINQFLWRNILTDDLGIGQERQLNVGRLPPPPARLRLQTQSTSISIRPDKNQNPRTNSRFRGSQASPGRGGHGGAGSRRFPQAARVRRRASRPGAAGPRPGRKCAATRRSRSPRRGRTARPPPSRRGHRSCSRQRSYFPHPSVLVSGYRAGRRRAQCMSTRVGSTESLRNGASGGVMRGRDLDFSETSSSIHGWPEAWKRETMKCWAVWGWKRKCGEETKVVNASFP